MKKARFFCRKCQFEFVIDIFEPGEAEKKKANAAPVCCPKCGGPVEK